VPPEQCLRPDDERGPGAPRHGPARCRQQDPVDPVEPRARDLALQDPHLVPEHQQLDVPLVRWTASSSDHALPVPAVS
jgi:hypothetical protein